MNNLKAEFITYKIIKKILSIICLFGILGFVFLSLGENSEIFRNGWISIVLMSFGAVGVEYCNFRIKILKKKYSSLKRNRDIKNKIIEFDKIA